MFFFNMADQSSFNDSVLRTQTTQEPQSLVGFLKEFARTFKEGIFGDIILNDVY